MVRVLLALAFAPSGLVKIVGDPFTTLPTSDPVGYFFAGFFSAIGYYRFVGVAQWVAGALLLIPRTATLGAFLYLPIIVNIFAITLAIGPSFAGTRVVTGALLGANVYLLCWDWDRWKGILPTTSVKARHGDFVMAAGMMLAAGTGFVGITGAHLARIQGGDVAKPVGMIVAAGLLGVFMLVTTYRRAKLPS
jgi:hypothetical protein